MKKELAAVLLLLAIAALSVWNTCRLNRLTDSLLACASEAREAAEAEDWEAAARRTEALSHCWEAAAPYTRVFLRHPDIDAVTDALSSVQSAVASADLNACRTALNSLRARLSSIREMETPGPGSIF